MMNKKEVRKLIRAKRIELSDRECRKLSKMIFDKVIEMDCFKKAETVLLYNSINNEVDTSDFIKYCKDNGKIVGFPRITGDDMIFYRIDDENDVEFGFMGIPEPIENADKIVEPKDGVVIVPGVAYDVNCNRTGYGRGFYDRYLNHHTSLTTVGIGYSFQVFDEVETGEFDKQLDFVVTEKNIYHK